MYNINGLKLMKNTEGILGEVQEVRRVCNTTV